MSKLITNPYHASPDPRGLTRVSCRVSAVDHALIERLFLHLNGLQDVILSTLYHDFIQRLRTTFNIPTGCAVPDDNVAWFDDHASIDILRGLLGIADRTGDNTAASAQHDAGGVNRLHQGVQYIEAIGADTPGDAEPRSDSPRCRKEDQDQKERQRVPRNGPIGTTNVEDLMRQVGLID